MDTSELLKLIPKDSFLKISGLAPKTLKREERAALIRKGNELFNKGKYDLAKRIYITTGYSDGLIRMAEYYLSIKEPLEALKMYWIAPHKKRVEGMIEKSAQILSKWLKEKECKEEERKESEHE
jgi:hypothetical protein